MTMNLTSAAMRKEKKERMEVRPCKLHLYIQPAR